VTGRPVQYETGLFKKPGQFAAFPDSEINISPIEGTAEGTIVSDVSIMSVGVTIYDHVTLIVKGGKVADIQGGMAAAKLSQILKSLNDEKAYNYAEFGIGLNPNRGLQRPISKTSAAWGTVTRGSAATSPSGKGARAEPYRRDVPGRHGLVRREGRLGQRRLQNLKKGSVCRGEWRTKEVVRKKQGS